MAKGDALLAGFNVKGHYRFGGLIPLQNTQAAAARLFTLRNVGPNLLIPTRLVLHAIQSAAGTAQQAAIGVYRLTGFTASDNTNSSALTASVMSTRGDMATAP